MYGKGFTSLRSNRKQNHLAMHLCQNLRGVPWHTSTSAQSPYLPQLGTPGSVQALWCSPAALGEPLPCWEEELFLKLYVYMKKYVIYSCP